MFLEADRMFSICNTTCNCILGKMVQMKHQMSGHVVVFCLFVCVFFFILLYSSFYSQESTRTFRRAAGQMASSAICYHTQDVTFERMMSLNQETHDCFIWRFFSRLTHLT